MVICYRLHRRTFFLVVGGIMTKRLVMPPRKEDLLEVIDCADAILFGIRGFSVNFTEIPKEELEKVCMTVKKQRKELFISLNKNMHNGDLPVLEELLKQCAALGVDGVFYYDVAVLEICHRLSLDLSLIWSAEHLTTNGYTVSYWHKFGVDGVFLSNEITKREILDIHRISGAMCITQVFGYLPMYVSKRHAVQNYLSHFDLEEEESKHFYLAKEGNIYPIIEREVGTEIYSSFIMNALEEYLEYQKCNMDYVFLSGFLIPLDKFRQVLAYFEIVNDENLKMLEERLAALFTNTGKGFLYRETVYQVK